MIKQVELRIHIGDLGEPRVADRFSISSMGNGNDEVLDGGNVQVHAAR